MKKLFCLALCLVALSGCGTNEVALDPIQSAVDNGYKDGFEYTKLKKLNSEEVNDEYRDLKLEKSEDYDVTYKEVTATSSYNDVCSMGTNDDVLYPGAFIDLSNNAYAPINLKKAPLTISANLETAVSSDKTIAQTIDEPSLSTVRSGIQKIVSDNIKTTKDLPSNMSIDIREISDVNEFYLNIGFGLQYKKLGIAENFDYGNKKKQTNLAVVIKQIYYNVDIDHSGMGTLIDQSVSNSEINAAFKGKIPGYVSSISYGRIVILTIQTNYASSEIKNVLSQTWGEMSEHPGSSSRKSLSDEFKNTIQNISEDTETNINCFIYGGGSSTAGNALKITSATDIASFFDSYDASSSVGLPILFRIRNFDGTLAKFQDTSSYVIKEVIYNPKRILSWSFLTDLISDGSIFDTETLKIDLSSMLNYNDLENSDINANKTITIPENIKDFYLIGPNNVTKQVEYNNLSLNVAYRKVTNPLTLHLKNISFIADSNEKEANGVAISSDCDSVLNLEIDGRVSLKGNNGVSVFAHNLNIIGEGNLSIIGGESSSGIETTNSCNIDLVGSFTVSGGIGSHDESGNGLTGGIGIVASEVTLKATSASYVNGGNGGNGIDGENGTGTTINGKYNTSDGKNGSNGGNGNISIECDELNVLSKTITFVGGNGGIGGNGGRGCGGSVSWYTGTDLSSGSNGGNAGNGGNGSIPMKLNLLNSIKATSYKISLYCGSGGNGGNGGNGGDGGIDDGGGVLILDNSQHKGISAGNGGNGGNGGNTEHYQNADFGDSLLVVDVSSAPGLGGTLGLAGKQGYIYNHSWDHGNYYGNKGSDGTSNGSNGAIIYK